MASPKWRGPPPRDADGDPRNCRKLASRDASSITKSPSRGQGRRKSLRREIYRFIEAHPGAKFSDLGRIHGVRGTESLTLGENVILWSGMSPAAIDAIIELLDAKAIQAFGPALAEYLSIPKGTGAGIVEIMPLPILRDPIQPASPHWFPAVLFTRDAWAERADGGLRN